MNLMIVDDDKQIREGISKGIKWETIGIDKVSAYQDGIDALKAVPEFRPDIILCDVCMPEMNGIDFLREVKKLIPGIRVILISGYSDFEYVQQAIKLGAIDYELKPLKARSLIRRITALRDEILAEKNSSSLNLKYQQEYRQNTFLKIVRGDIEDYNIIKEFFENYFGMENFNDFLMMLIVTDGKNDYHIKNEFKDEILQLLKDKYGDDVVTLQREEECIILMRVVNSALYVQERYVGLMRAFSGFQTPNKESSCTAVLSEQHSLKYIADTYKRLHIISKTRFYTGSGVLFEEKRTMRQSTKKIDIHKTGKNLVNNIKEGKTYLEEINEISEYWKENFTDSPSEIRHYLTGWIYEISLNGKYNLNPGEFGKRIENMEYLSDIITEFKRVLADAIEFQQENIKSMYGQTVIRALEYIQEHYRESISVEQIASYVQKSPNYFSAVFKKEVGVSFSLFINQLRINEAKRLLKETMLPLSEIAVLAGYSDYAYFVSVFKKLEGCSPSNLRKNHEYL